MTKLSRRLMTVYIGLILILAVLGAQNRRHYAQTTELVREREKIAQQVENVRFEAEKITSPQVVRAWAESQGMIAYASTRIRTQHVMPQELPTTSSLSPNSIEVKTAW